MLEVFCSKQIYIREENISDILGIKLLYISDLHFGALCSHKVLAQVIKILKEHEYHVFVLGGDLIDWFPNWNYLTKFLESIPSEKPWGLVLGNHDSRRYLKRLKKLVAHYNGVWLEDTPIKLTADGRSICITGHSKLIKDDLAFNVLCLHDPATIVQHPIQNVDLALAGHLHGSQIVIKQQGTLLYPGALFFRWNGLRFEMDRTVLLVSRGLNDTIPIRFNCPREVILCHL